MKAIADIIRSAGAALGASGKAPPRIAVAVAQDEAVLGCLSEVRRTGLADAVLVGNRKQIEQIARKKGIDISGFEIVREEDHAEAALKAVGLVRDGKADLVMKGLVESAVFLRAVLRKDMGLNTGRLVSHVVVIESPFYHKLLFLSDGAINIAPGIPEKQVIIENAAGLAHSMGIRMPKVALLAALEQVNPGKMPCTAEAAILTQMNRRGRFPGCVVDGPLALDNAVSSESARVKGIHSPVAGDADILITPSIESGNILYKCLMDLGNAKGAALVLGTRVPVILTSRADTAETKQASVALGILSWLYPEVPAG